MRIDMGWRGPLGADFTIRRGVAYFGGTNHWLEWLHHFLPGARRREIRWAREAALVIQSTEVMVHTISGHSVGGTVATIAAAMLADRGIDIRLYTYGAKRPPRKYRHTGEHYRIKGDPVPALPPWRPALNTITLDYGKKSWVEAHGPASYFDQMARDGIR